MSDQTLNTKEAVYDAEIAPLMTQIIEILQATKNRRAGDVCTRRRTGWQCDSLHDRAAVR